jgi:mono/diheme cytochrome c family protein
MLEDREPRMRIQAIRASETLYKLGDKSLAQDYERMTKDASVDVAIQAMLTIGRWKVPNGDQILQATMDANKARGVQVVGSTLLNASASAGRGRGGLPLAPEQQQLLERGGEVYNGLCMSCHGLDGTGTPNADGKTTKAPPLAGSPRVTGHRDYVTNVVLYGLTGAVDQRTYNDVMIPMGSNTDEWIASVASYVRNSFGNFGGFVTTDDVARVRATSGTRDRQWDVEELQAALPVPLVPNGWTATASHNAAAAVRAFSLQSWNSGAPQTAGMWFQVALPAPARLAELQFESTVGAYEITRGRILNLDAPPGGARGARAAAAPAPAPPPMPTAGYPRGYKVEVSLDGQTWTEVAHGRDTWHDVLAIPASGTGVQGSEGAVTTTVTFKPVSAKFVRITQTEDVPNAPVWSIQQFRLFEAAKR